MPSERTDQDEYYILTDSENYKEKPYKDERELEQMAIGRSKEIFGENSFYFDIKLKVTSKFRPRVTDGLLLDVRDRKHPRVWIVEYELSSHDFERVVGPQLRGFDEALKNPRTLRDIEDTIYEQIRADPGKVEKLKTLVGADDDIHYVIHKAIHKDPGVLVILDNAPEPIEDVVDANLKHYLIVLFRTFEKDGKLVHLIRGSNKRPQVVPESEVQLNVAEPGESYDPQQWVQQGPSESTRNNRRATLIWWSKANNSAEPKALVSEIRSGKVDAYDAAKKMVELMLDRGQARSTTSLARSRLKLFYSYADFPFKEAQYEKRVPPVQNITETEQEELSPDQLKTLMTYLKKEPLLQAFFSFLISTGCQLGEALEVRVSDIDFDKIPARVQFSRGKTKDHRYSFLSSETIKLLRNSLGPKPDPGSKIFPLGNPNGAYSVLNTRLRNAGLAKQIRVGEKKQIGRWSVSPRTFRSANLGFATKADYRESWAKYLVGKKAIFDGSLDELAESWQKKVEPLMRFLPDQTVP